MKNEGFEVLKIEKMIIYFIIKDFLLKNKGFEVLKTEKDFIVLENLGKTLWIIGFLFIEDEYFNIPLEVIWNIHCKSLQQKKTDILTRARGKFGLWKMVEKIKTCIDIGSERNNISVGSRPSVFFGNAKGRSKDGLGGFDSDGDG